MVWMIQILFSLATFVSTLCGGLLALKHRDKLHSLLGYAAGVILGVIAFDLLPEIFKLTREQSLDAALPMIMLVIGFLTFHVIEKSILIHNGHEDEYGGHHHPHVGIASALALSGHSFLDGVGIGLGFQVNATVGFAVAVAVIAHDFTDGMNTVSLMLTHRNNRRRSLLLLLLDATAPVLGALSTLAFTISDKVMVLYLGFFAGFLLYIGASEILPEAHSRRSSYSTIMLTVLGVCVMYVVTRFA